MIVLPTNWPPGAETTAQYVVNARAVENNVYFMSVNRVGDERGFRFIGHSRIAHPFGNTMAEAGGDGEAILYADIEPRMARKKHLVRVPGKHEIDRLADRHPAMYGRADRAAQLEAAAANDVGGFRLLHPRGLSGQARTANAAPPFPLFLGHRFRLRRTHTFCLVDDL